MSSANSNSSHSSKTTTEKDPQDALASCLFSQYQFCVAGVGLATAFSMQNKKYGFAALVVGGATGSLFDMMYGYSVACVEERERYDKWSKQQDGQTPRIQTFPINDKKPNNPQ